jgi:hypothetical protein
MATTDEPAPEHRRPAGASDDAVAAAGAMTEALETLVRAQGHLYSAHQLIGQADLQLDGALDALREAGAAALADEIARDLVGRNVLAGRWTFQVVEEFEDGYMATFRAKEQAVREALTGGRRHVYEAEMKERRRSAGRRGHEARPAD